MNESANLRSKIRAVFTPSRPVTRDAVFAGRENEIRQLEYALGEPGRSAVVFGTRGIGKTSLAQLVRHRAELAPTEADRIQGVWYSCSHDDDYDHIWKTIFGQIEILAMPGGVRVPRALAPSDDRSPFDIAGPVAEGSEELIVPQTVTRVLAGMANVVFFLDEFDVVDDEETRWLFAETFKHLSDLARASPTLVLIGVAQDLRQLVGYHESIQRCVEQIHMDRMTDAEVAGFVHNGFSLIDGLRAEDSAVTAIAALARGYPAFAHSLSREAAEIAVNDGRDIIVFADVLGGALQAVDRIPYSLADTFAAAVDSRHPSDDTRSTVAAIVFCQSRFRPSDVQRQLEIWGKHASITTISNHMKNLTKPSRGRILISGEGSHPWYQLADPLFRPYAAIRFLGEHPPQAIDVHDI